MKRGLVLFSIILLVVPMASASFFNDFFEKFTERTGSGITGYAALPSISSLLGTKATTTAPIATAPKTTTTTTKAATTPTALPKAAASTTNTKVALAVPSVKLVKPAAAKLSKVSFARGAYDLGSDRMLFITSVVGDTANAKMEEVISDGKVVMIGDKYYKVQVLQDQSRIKFVPTTERPKDSDAPKEVKTPAAAKAAASATKTPATPTAATKTPATPTAAKASATAGKTAASSTAASKAATTSSTGTKTGFLGGLFK